MVVCIAYDLSEAFEAIEDELIGSMVRNLKRHRAEETELGFNWEQWQVLQLKALEDYRKRNLKKFPPRFNKLNLQIDEILRSSYRDGATSQERKILQAIRKGFNAPASPFSGETEISGDFFQVNDRKLDALIEATTHDMEQAEYAVLRRADDRYRQTIFNAQVYANTGAGTYEKAVDMATRDFLRAGLDCVEYKNGSRHTLEDYADMAIKTANKRAYLQGEGGMRDEWGVPTVIMNKRSCPCPLCAPFVGKVFIDDVWSGADKSGISPVTGVKYPLLSDAIAQGLYHPRCKDVHSTYFEGISTPPEGSQYTADELDEMAQQYEAEQKQGYCERQEKRYDRMSRYSLDEENQRIYGARAKAFGEKAEQFGKVAKAFKKPDKNVAETIEKSGGSGMIESEIGGFSPLPSDKVVDTLRQESESWIKSLNEKEVRSIKKYTKNSGDTKTNKFFAKLNAMLRGDLPEDTRLRYHAENISSGLKKNKLRQDILCYRSVDFNPIQGLRVGDMYEPKQFLSSSVTKKGILKGEYIMVIETPKGSGGAYIEGLSKYPKQREFLFDYDCKYRIKYVKGKNIGLEVII